MVVKTGWTNKMNKVISIMIYLCISTITPSIFANPVSDLDRTTVLQDSKNILDLRYGNDYDAINILLNADAEAYDYLVSQESTQVSDDLLIHLIEKWYPHMYLIMEYYDAEMKAYLYLQYENEHSFPYQNY